MKKIGVLLALAYAFITGMAVATVTAHMDQARIDELSASRWATSPKLLTCDEGGQYRKAAGAEQDVERFGLFLVVAA